jgi:hypothetical protein
MALSDDDRVAFLNNHYVRCVSSNVQEARYNPESERLSIGFGQPLHALTGLQQPTLPDGRERILGWQGWLDLQLLRREAEAALKP